MNVKDLRTLVDNLEEYIHVPGGIERLKRTILHLAVSGKLVPQDSSEGTGKELYEQIQLEKAKLIIDGKLKKQEPLTRLASDEEPFEIPKSWTWLRLGDIIQVSSGSFLPSSKMAEDFEYPVYGGNGISGYYEKFLYPKPVIVIGRVGAQCGNVHMTLPNAWVTDNAFVVRYTDAFIYSEYLVLALRQLDLRSTHKGSAQPVISGRSIYQLPFQLPPLDEQVRIMDKVEDIFLLIDDLAERYRFELVERRKLVVSSFAKSAKGESDLALDLLTEMIKTKEDAAELRKTILHLAVSGKLVPQDSSEGTGQELYYQIQVEKVKLGTEGKIKRQKLPPEISEDDNPFEIPKSWKWVRLGGVSIYQQRGKSPKYTTVSDYPVISQRCVRTSYIDWQVVKYITPESVEKYESFRFLRNGDLLLNSTGTGTMGRIGMFRSNLKFDKVVADSHVTVVRMLDTVQSDFMHIFLNAPFVQNNVESKASGSTNQIEWNLSSIQEEIIAFPPFEEQKRIVKRTNELLSLVSELERKVEK